LVFLAIWAIRPRLCSVHIQSLNHNTAPRDIPLRPISKQPLNASGEIQTPLEQ